MAMSVENMNINPMPKLIRATRTNAMTPKRRLRKLTIESV